MSTADAPPTILYSVGPKDGTRETIESIVVAFVLAFLFKTFEAEAFVIPTGSMAPTLRGLNFDVAGDLSGYRAAYGTPPNLSQPIESCIEPLYNHPMPLKKEANPPLPQRNANFYSYSGDRILVSKIAYLFNDPERWDVVVFKYPGEAQTNFIKRLVGRPSETVRLQRGDVLAAPSAAAGEQRVFTVQRKPPEKMLAMMQPVFDSDYAVPGLAAKGVPQRFVGEPATAFTTPDDGKTYDLVEPAAQLTWLRYQHAIPLPNQWEVLDAGGQVDAIPPRLITDACPYNTGDSPISPFRSSSLGMHWVGDLMVQGAVDVSEAGPNGTVVVELIKGGRAFQARIALATGAAELWHEDVKLGASKGPTALVGTGVHTLRFSNVDCQLRLWIDDQLIEFDTDGAYEPWDLMKPNQRDLAPASIGVQDAKAKLSSLKVWRDIYYIAGIEENDFGGPLDYDQRVFGRRRMAMDRNEELLKLEAVGAFFADPSRWDVFGEPGGMAHSDYELGDGQFFMLGDNSPRSADGREWGRHGLPYYVERRLLIGKALLIYWPHGWEFPWHVTIPLDKEGEGGSLRIPFYPDFSRLFKLIK